MQPTMHVIIQAHAYTGTVKRFAGVALYPVFIPHQQDCVLRKHGDSHQAKEKMLSIIELEGKIGLTWLIILGKNKEKAYRGMTLPAYNITVTPHEKSKPQVDRNYTYFPAKSSSQADSARYISS